MINTKVQRKRILFLSSSFFIFNFYSIEIRTKDIERLVRDRGRKGWKDGPSLTPKAIEIWREREREKSRPSKEVKRIKKGGQTDGRALGELKDASLFSKSRTFECLFFFLLFWPSLRYGRHRNHTHESHTSEKTNRHHRMRFLFFFPLSPWIMKRCRQQQRLLLYY